jgi:hypothetical protein
MDTAPGQSSSRQNRSRRPAATLMTGTSVFHSKVTAVTAFAGVNERFAAKDGAFFDRWPQ